MIGSHQGDLTVTDYFTKLKTIWDELENFRPLPFCKCVIACSCGAVSMIKKYRDEDYVIRFLKSLNEQYSHVKSQVLMLEPLPPLTKVFSMVVQQERQMNTTVIPDSISNLNLALNAVANQFQKENYGKEPLLAKVKAEVKGVNKTPNFALTVVSITIQLRSVTLK